MTRVHLDQPDLLLYGASGRDDGEVVDLDRPLGDPSKVGVDVGKMLPRSATEGWHDRVTSMSTIPTTRAMVFVVSCPMNFAS